ncbi:hypothetical protein V1477_011915 [Vespula maculifrons]|uniref:Uncharacterized protein n=1 Tax=Vespula maculifrons TaxID=7453 RepID=A0ABD2C0J7_VESMC
MYVFYTSYYQSLVSDFIVSCNTDKFIRKYYNVPRNTMCYRLNRILCNIYVKKQHYNTHGINMMNESFANYNVAVGYNCNITIFYQKLFFNYIKSSKSDSHLI